MHDATGGDGHGPLHALRRARVRVLGLTAAMQLLLLLVLAPIAPTADAAGAAAAITSTAAEMPRARESHTGWAAVQAQLEARVRAAYPAATEVAITAPEAAQRLVPTCPGGLLVDPQGARLFGNLSVRITCGTAGQAPTGRATAARLPVAIRVLVPMLVARAAIPRGSVVDAGMLDLAPTPVGSASDYLVDMHAMLGQRTRTGLRAGQVLTLAQVEMGPLVTAGEQVALVAGDAEFSVSVAAKALQSGRAGEQIRVRNIASGRVVPAWVVSRGTAHTRPPRTGPRPATGGARAAAAPNTKE